METRVVPPVGPPPPKKNQDGGVIFVTQITKPDFYDKEMMILKLL